MEHLVEVQDLKKSFLTKGGIFGKSSDVKAVDGVDLYLNKGETLGVVGESGCGKTTLGRLVLRLIKPTSGKINFDEVDITNLSERKLLWLRKRTGMVFQDPSASLNPRMNIRNTLKRPLVVHGIKDENTIQKRIVEMLEKVGLNEDQLERFPHQISGGQQQRVAIARAIMLNPDLVVLDEPTSSLDVSVQAQILNLLLKLQRDLNLTYLFITHDLVVERHVSDRIVVMYCGKILESADTDELLGNTMHPYTVSLFSSTPIPHPHLKSTNRFIVGGEPPSLIRPPRGCRFHSRCPYAEGKCKKVEPKLVEAAKDHFVACHKFEEIDLLTYVKRFWKLMERLN
jgi:oligopeptide/dipeptide ABC transporter ATP-binding protein